MAVNWGSLIFGGVESSEYGIYLSGEGVYNAPERAVEVVDVPGRNGAVLIDQGHWNNIEVVYKAGVFGANQETFSEKLSAFRNAILSQTGYQRLSDTYHPEEFRMGAYVSGLEVSPASYNRHGEFELIFNCKPQRWLVDGNLPIPIDSGDVLENLTPYESSPMILAEGYGLLSFNGYDINLKNDVFGEMVLWQSDLVGTTKQMDSTATSPQLVHTVKFLGETVATGDSIVFDGTTNFYGEMTGPGTTDVTKTSESGVGSVDIGTTSSGNLFWSFVVPAQTFTKGTAKQVYNQTVLSAPQGSTPNIHQTQLTLTIDYDGNETFTFSVWEKYIGYGFFPTKYKNANIRYPSATCDSTATILGHPTYIDCETGEVYKYMAGRMISLNGQISLGGDLPRLAPGPNVVSFANTYTDVKITPRWWKI